MILHKYYNIYGFDTLANLELKVSIPSKFNDPFEFLPKIIGKWDLTHSKEYLKGKNPNVLAQELKTNGIPINEKIVTDILNNEEFAKLYSDEHSEEFFGNMILGMRKYADEITRIICFSSEETTETEQILLWSHYTDGHSGIRFHFDSELLVESKNDLKNIYYVNTRPALDSTQDPFSDEFKNSLMETIRTKSEVWTYEKEYRLFVSPPKCITRYIKTEKMYFLKFDSKSLVRIDLGVNCSEQMQDDIFIELQKPDKSHIKLYRAKINPHEYKLDYEEIN